MAVKKSIVNSGGQFEQIQAGDKLLGVTLTEVEIDFGIIPISSANFSIVDADITISNVIQVFPSPNPGTGRVGNDWEFDMPFFTAIAQNGGFNLAVVLSHQLVGPRKIYYKIY